MVISKDLEERLGLVRNRCPLGRWSPIGLVGQPMQLVYRNA
jgi:hypothetical protein